MPATRHPLSLQYLGARGDTQSCVDAMVTILTSPYPCREITVVFGDTYPADENRHFSVLFVIWDWVGHEITIVPDGFGTHEGTGGWGLAIVLELIQYYQVHLVEKWIEKAQFNRIADGFPTERDRQQLHHADYGAPSWPLHLDDFGSELWAQLPLKAFPHWLLEPELVADVKGVEQDPDSAAFRAVKRLEVIIRGMGGYAADLLGEKLINTAMGSQGSFQPLGATESERQAWASLFRGAMGAFKNPQSHRDVKLSMEDAAGQILAVNLLIRKLKRDFPKSFKKKARNARLEHLPTPHLC